MLLPFTKAFRAVVLEVAEAHVDERVFSDLAPKGTEMPYLVISVASGSTPNRIRLIEGRVTFNVQVVTNGDKPAGAVLASQIYDEIFNHLTNLDTVVAFDAPWKFYELNHLTTYRRIETVDNQRLAYAGGHYLLEADKM